MDSFIVRHEDGILVAYAKFGAIRTFEFQDVEHAASEWLRQISILFFVVI